MAAASLASAAEKPRPLMRDFIGLCVHTVQFKPALYAPVAHLVRDYHPMLWDVGGETDHATEFPLARNKVDWQELYGAWVKGGYRIDADLMFDNIDPKAWRDPSHDAYAYGNAFARYFGPSGKALVECLEIGNEPGKYDDAVYRQIFEGMARGAREGDRRLRIATCAVNLGKRAATRKASIASQDSPSFMMWLIFTSTRRSKAGRPGGEASRKIRASISSVTWAMS